MQEKIICNQIGVFDALSKHNFVVICLNTIEKEYGGIKYSVLQEIRTNFSLDYHIDSGFWDYNYIMRIIGKEMENINCWSKALLLKANLEYWQRHTPNIVAAKQSAVFEKQKIMTNSMMTNT